MENKNADKGTGIGVVVLFVAIVIVATIVLKYILG